jgi:hypothetical protein
LSQNNITNFGLKAFCSRYSQRNEISGLEIDSSSLINLNKCTIKQMRPFNDSLFKTMIKVISVDPLSDKHACNCTLINFLRYFNFDIGGVCSNADCPIKKIADDCKTSNLYACDNSTIPLTTTTTSATTTLTTTSILTTISEKTPAKGFSPKSTHNSIFLILSLILFNILIKF